MHSYDDHALETLRRQGVDAIELWCLTPTCSNRITIPIDMAIEAWGPGTMIVMIARRARCQWCRRDPRRKAGAHVQATAPPSKGTSGRPAWRKKRILILREEIDRLFTEDR